MTDAINVCINSHGRLLKCHRKYYISRLTPHPAERCQLFDVIRHHAVKVIDQLFSHRYQVFRLGIRIRHTFDVGEYVRFSGRGHCCGIWISLEERRGNHVYSFVGALGTEHGSHEQLERTFIKQFGSHIGLSLAEIIDNKSVAVFSVHGEVNKGGPKPA